MVATRGHSAVSVLAEAARHLRCDEGEVEVIDRPDLRGRLYRARRRQVLLTYEMILKIEGPAPDPFIEGFFALAEALWEVQKRKDRRGPLP